MSDRSFRFLYSNFRTRSNLSALFERRETHRVAPKRSVGFEIELLFQRGGGNDHEGSFQSRVKLTLETIRNLLQDRFEDSAQGWKTCCIVVSSSIDGKARRGISTTRIFHLLNLKRRVCILFRVYIIIVAWKMFANISRNETSNEQRIRTNLKLMRGNRSIGATTVSTDRLTIRSSFHYFAYFSRLVDKILSLSFYRSFPNNVTQNITTLMRIKNFRTTLMIDTG